MYNSIYTFLLQDTTVDEDGSNNSWRYEKTNLNSQSILNIAQAILPDKIPLYWLKKIKTQDIRTAITCADIFPF